MYRYVGIWIQSNIWFVYSYPSIGICSFIHVQYQNWNCFNLIQSQWILFVGLYKNWKLYYQISILVYSKHHQFHVIIFIHPFYNQPIILSSFGQYFFTSCSIFTNFEGGRNNIGKYPFDKILIAHEYFLTGSQIIHTF